MWFVHGCLGEGEFYSILIEMQHVMIARLLRVGNSFSFAAAASATVLAPNATIRKHEIRKLQWKQVELFQGVLKVGKSKRAPLPPSCHPEPTRCHSAPIRCPPEPVRCHSERSEESRSAAQRKLREGSAFALTRIAREQVAELIGAHSMEVIFTSCATEAIEVCSRQLAVKAFSILTVNCKLWTVNSSPRGTSSRLRWNILPF
jgi:hypothetical protein